MRTEVNSIRNVPNYGSKEYPIDGYVKNDANKDGTPGALEPGLANATVRCGPYSATTNALGYFMFRVRAGTYTLRNVPPPGFGVSSNPDSSVASVGPAASATATASFADTAIAGGWVTAYTFNDVNANGVVDGGEAPLQNVKIAISPGTQVSYTDPSGYAQLFAMAGGYTVTATAPDSFMFTTPNPYSGSMSNGGSASIQFGLNRTPVGTVNGTVFRDNNRDGLINGTDTGIGNVWVGVTNDGGVTIQGFQYTNASGNYSIQVPINSPPGDHALLDHRDRPAGLLSDHDHRDHADLGHGRRDAQQQEFRHVLLPGDHAQRQPGAEPGERRPLGEAGQRQRRQQRASRRRHRARRGCRRHRQRLGVVQPVRQHAALQRRPGLHPQRAAVGAVAGGRYARHRRARRRAPTW